jgi:Tol biopolymer transport system component
MNILSLNKKLFKIFIAVAFSISIFNGCTPKNNAILSSSQEVSALSNPVTEKKLAVVIRKNELLLINLNGNKKNKLLDNNGSFARPLISPDKNHVAYLKNNSLYVTSIEGNNTKIVDNIEMLSFTWKDKNRIIYSPTTGGLYLYDIVKKEHDDILKNQYNYQNITLQGNSKIYAEQYLNYEKNGSAYREDFGVIEYNQATKENKIIIKSIPSGLNINGNLGMYPIIAGKSVNSEYLFIFKHPHSGSMAADGVEFAAYDILNNKFIEYSPSIISLGYKDNLSPDPLDDKYIAFILGGGREMGKNKKLVHFNILSGNFDSLSPERETAMTPFYSKDGKAILYAASEEQQPDEGPGQWLSGQKHYIYSIDSATKRIKRLTTNPKAFDFAPVFINDDNIAFFRSDEKGNVSMWKSENGNEVMLVDDLIFSNNTDYSIQNYYGHFNNELFTDIK